MINLYVSVMCVLCERITKGISSVVVGDWQWNEGLIILYRMLQTKLTFLY